MLEKVRKIIYNKCLCKHEYDTLLKGVVIGFSGGADSTVLLHVFSKIAKDIPFTIHAVHINHGLRGNDADEDEKFCKEFAESLGVQFSSYRCNILQEAKERKIGLEECGRLVRYKIFEEVMRKNHIELLALAHNKNDAAETVLMNIARGCGLNGISGIDYRRDYVIRPLLDCSRDEIECYCSENQLNARVDKSNYEDVYTRNKVRNKLLPFMNEIFGRDMIKKLTELSDHIRIDKDYIDTNADVCFEKLVSFESNQSAVIDAKELTDIHEAVAGRILLKTIIKIKGDLNKISKIHIHDILDMANKKVTGKRIHLPDQLVTWYKYGKIVIKHDVTEEIQTQYPDVVLNTKGETIWGDHVFTLTGHSELTDNKDELRATFDRSMIEGAVIRNRRPGDMIYLYKRNCKKKLKAFFIDEKIPLEKRAQIPLIAKGNDIIWIVGYAKNGKYHQHSQSENSITITVKKRTV